ncbi:hypothetical protein DWB79_02575 [Treponema medium]|uniref:Uncharacterized protein n=2 Tax=Treponema medium TaxID=58231 RepID=A0AA87TFP7_TREMD|nr:hypothetical protein [Treponema medium]EPF29798.1 hypothetical protein HMPREF9195_00511 [Treponema medium ATCC 700293]QSH96659.1 hypothetical protein DWB79_02575 [Treponema medium]
MHLHKKAVAVVLLTVIAIHLYAFDSGFTLGLKANLTGSLTDPRINKKDLDYLGGNRMKGMLGYITTGEADLTYLFDSIRYFRLQDNSVFGGLGWSFALGLGQGFSGQISGQFNDKLNGGKGKQIDVFCRVHMTPVLTLTSGVRSYFLRNRLSLGLNTGIRMPLDPQPIYELYTNLTPDEVEELKKEKLDFSSETGTLLITQEQMKKINPVGFIFKGFIEYNQPFLSNMEIVLGGFLSYTIYKPKYVTMPQKLIDAAKAGGAAKGITVDVVNTPINSFYMNSLDFGITIGLTFKV